MASGGGHEGGDGAFACSFSGDESDAIVRPKYVRRRSSPESKDEEDDELQLGFWTIIGEAISKIIERERPACLISKEKRMKHSLKVNKAPKNLRARSIHVHNPLRETHVHVHTTPRKSHESIPSMT